ncbi:MAG: hypothetical protein JWM98_1440, partial [Thermoleophilia bacterium]|nr:hypothetical protein [Thermoleophilia bacterium]
RRATAGATLRAVPDASPGEPGGGQALLAAPLAVAGALTTAVALVRPLADGSPFLALAGLACVGAAALLVRRR